MSTEVLIMCLVWMVYLCVLLPVYIRKEARDGTVSAVNHKLALSDICCIIGLLSVFVHQAELFSVFIFIGLCSAILGDYYIAYMQESEPKFIRGILFFSLTQLMYFLAFILMGGYRLWEAVAVLLLFVPVYYYKSKMRMPDRKVDMVLSVYVLFLLMMVVRAIGLFVSQEVSYPSGYLFAIGAVLFLISDLALGTWRFLRPYKALSYVVAICYFLAQLMIASASFYY